MMTLVVGGAASGKSAYAERLLLRSGARRKLYIATMEPYGEEGRRRIGRHRALRAGKGFETVECYRDLALAELPEGSAALLECVGNLCANELYRPDGGGEGAGERVVQGVKHLREQCVDLVVVSNEVFTGGHDYGEGTREYLRQLGRVNRELAVLADSVCEVSCGIPVYYKGEEPKP